MLGWSVARTDGWAVHGSALLELRYPQGLHCCWHAHGQELCGPLGLKSTTQGAAGGEAVWLPKRCHTWAGGSVAMNHPGSWLDAVFLGTLPSLCACP